MKKRTRGMLRILLSSTVLLVMGTVFIGGAQVRRGGHRDDLTRQARQLQRAAESLYDLLSRSSTHRGHIAWDARELAEESRHFLRSALRSRRVESLDDDFQQVRESFHRLRRSWHGRFHVHSIQGRDRWYAQLMRAWADTAEHFSDLNDYFRGRGRPRPDPRDPIAVPVYPIQTREIRCKSEDFKPNSCYVGGRIQSLELIDRKSRAACVEGRTFGSQGAYVWVKNGCDAILRVHYWQDRPR